MFDVYCYYRALAKSAGLGKIPNRVDIEHRSAEVDDRRFIGNWEGDTVVRGPKQSGLVTLIDRCSAYLLAAQLPKLSAESMRKAMILLLKPRQGDVQSIAMGNGSEFADHNTVT